MKKLITTALATLCTIVLMAQIPQAFKYQAVIRNNQGKVLVNQVVSLRISILQNDPLGDMVYVETHQIATNDYGIANISIGSGTVITGVFADIPWGTTTHFVKTELDITGNQNYEFIGTSQLLSVPYALYAAKAGNVADDLDKDPTNEIQALSFSNDTVYLSNGGKVYLGKYTDNTDSQSLHINGNTLSISGGNSVTFAGAVDLDADPINELQALSYSNDTIYLSKGNFVVLPHNWDNDTTNELQTVTQIGSIITLNKNGGSFTLLDDDITNEIQHLSIENDTIRLTKDGSIVLPDKSIKMLTQSQIDNLNPLIGDIVMNSDYNILQFFNGTIWVGASQTNCIPQPNKSIAGKDTCTLLPTINLSASIPKQGIKGQWSIINGNGGSFENLHNYNTIFNGQLNTEYLIQWNLYSICDTNSSIQRIVMKGAPEYGTVSDMENNIYQTVKIGNQIWMAENLKSLKYNDGSIIPKTNNWINLESHSPYISAYKFNDSNILNYGVIYNQSTVLTQKVCPTGWHIPSNEDWESLKDFLIFANYSYDGNSNYLAKAIASTINWNTNQSEPYLVGNQINLNNSTGFNAHSFGEYFGQNTFVENGERTAFWNSNGDYIQISGNQPTINTILFSENWLKATYIRCIKD